MVIYLKTINYRSMKTLIIILSISIFFSLDNVAQENKTKTSDDQKTGAGTETSKSTWSEERVNEYVKTAASGSMMEVQLGKLAQQKASSQQVKDFGQLMVKNHTEAGTKLKSAVKTSIPATLEEKHKNKVDKLSDKTGKEFDKEYMDMMVKDHEDDIKEFEQAQANVTDPALKSWISSTLPVLKQHLQKAKSIQEQLK